MAHFYDELRKTCEDLMTKNAGSSDLCTKITRVVSCCTGKLTTDSKQFLADVKQILLTKPLGHDEDLLLQFLVPLYLSVSSKNAAKRVLSSHFQGLPSPREEFVLQLLCQKVQESCDIVTGCDASNQENVRHVVDMLAALMDNFALGETCVSTMSSAAMVFLARAQDYFFQLFRQGGQSAVQVNAVMHHCHVTMQAMNRLTQRHLPRDAQPVQPLSQVTLARVMQTDILVMLEEQMMVDCRCCCAINLVLLLQMFAPEFLPQFIHKSLGLEPVTPDLPPAPSWLAGVQLSRMTLTSSSSSSSCLSPMTSLALMWGMVSMLDVSILTTAPTSETVKDAWAFGDSPGTGKNDSPSKNVDYDASSKKDDCRTSSNEADKGVVNVSLNVGTAASSDAPETPQKDSSIGEKAAAAVAEEDGGEGDPERAETVTRVGERGGGGTTTTTAAATRGSGEGEGEAGGTVCEALLGRLVGVDEACGSTVSRVQCVKTVTLWTSRIMNCLKEGAVSPAVCRRLQGEGQAVQRLFGYVWTHWHDQLDVIRQNSRIIFDNCLKLHVLASQCEDVPMDPFLLALLGEVLAMDWGSPCKLSALCSLAALLGPSPFLLRHPRFPATLLAQMVDQAVACHASELYEVLIGGDKKRGGAKGAASDSEAGWLCVWIDPIISQLCSSNKKLKQHIIEYILPKVMKKDKVVLEYMLSKLSSAGETGVEPLGALVVCLRRARAWGLMTEALHTQDGSAPVWSKILSALSSSEEQVRLDAYALLCENKRTAETISRVEFEHVRHFLAHNLNNQTPAFRQAMLAFSKKLFFRINESQQAMLRQRKKKQNLHESTAALQHYTSFLSWLEGFLFSQLYPSAAFARRTTSLALLTLLTQQVQGDDDPAGYRPLRDVTVNHVHTLLECLTDTFEENKEEAFKLLLVCTAQHPRLLTEETCGELYGAAMRLAVSTRPQDCGTAAYVFRLLLRQPCVGRVLASQGRHLSADNHPGHHCGQGGRGQGGPSGPPGKEEELGRACRVAQGEGVTPAASDSKDASQTAPTDSQLVKLMAKMKTRNDDNNKDDIANDDNASATLHNDDSDDDDDVSATLSLLRALLSLLVEQVAVAETSLIVAAANRPMYPTLHCIRYILDRVHFPSLKEGEITLWAQFVERLLHVCLQVATVVSPVVQNSSPEGNVPEEAVLGPGLKFDLGLMAEVEESRQTVALMPEYLVVCCWRSIKEVSLLLGLLCRHAPLAPHPHHPGGGQGVLSFQQMEEVGAYFKQQLLESLHRGAFELAYAGFVMMCQRLWESPWRELQTLPRRWLEEVMSAIMSTTAESSALCATRRSAGVPFFIQAIVATETPTSGRPSFHTAMSQLLGIALSSVPSAQSASTDAQVHALNVLRALFKDTRLGEDVAVYVSDGLRAAILGFKSQYWEVRNSATLLLSALMTRVFGVKRSKDETVLSKRNSQTGRAFFHKYPALYPFLLTELEMATQNLGGSGQFHLHPSLYPVLMVLGRLFPSTMEGGSTRLNLAAFLPHVIRCSSSPVYKTRMMAARALQPLVGKEQLTGVLTSLMTSLPSQPPSGSSDGKMAHSHVHGLLLQVYHLMLLSGDMTGSTLQTLMSVCLSGWLPLTWLITRQNPCLCTRKVALDITDLVLSIAATATTTATATPPVLPASSLPAATAEGRRHLEAISGRLFSVLRAEVWSPPSPPYYSPHTPFLSQLLGCVARLAMRHICCADGEREREEGGEGEGVVLRLLGFPAYEVHLAVLSWLQDRWGDDDEVVESTDGGCSNMEMATVPVCRNIPASSSDSRSSSSSSKGDGVAMTTAVVDHLLSMGLQDSAHQEAVVKIFELLSLPAVHNCLGNNIVHSSVFETLLRKLQRERRADVKAALIQFTGSLLPKVYHHLKHESSTTAHDATLLLQEWSQFLLSSCDAEQPDDLHLSCGRVLRDNWEFLLVDKDRRLGPLVFEFWSCLVTLLQADDLDVKDIVATVSSKLAARGTGGRHPEEALVQLITAMLRLHGNTQPLACVACALRWVTPRATDVAEEGAERLFDKGELNTFQDSVCLARVVSQCLEHVFSSHTSPPPTGQDASRTSHPQSLSPPLPSTIGQGNKCPSPSQVLSLSPSPNTAEPSMSLWSIDENHDELTRIIQETVDLMESRYSSTEAGSGSLESVFLRGAVYGERSVFLIRAALLVRGLQSLPVFRTEGGERLRVLCGKVREFVKEEVGRCGSCNTLLGTVVNSL
ncbi:tRNA (32-2'-O)-methyltransferase regulator THADA-like [Babylonia areolata]|uniref:tRNA (32-2'-O)-methyltransferase regulator THADA-like n=1 Tax=Babylonia areolata TaxID=304850 RepID=UPI003FD299F6